MKKIIIEVEDDKLHADFKAEVYANGQTIKDALIELIKYYLKPINLKKDEN